MTDADVAVVGAGLAGLVAARELTRAGLEVAVLEARDRVGGRTLNLDIGDGHVVEIGGQWVGPTHHRLLNLAAELDVDTFPTHTAGASLVETDGELTRFAGDVPRLHPVALADFGQSAYRLDRMAEDVDLDAPWETPRAELLDSRTFWSWMRRNVATTTGLRAWRTLIQSIWAVEPKDVSLLHVLFYIAASGGIEYLMAFENGAQQDRFIGGSQRVALAIADELGSRVLLGAPVHRISQDPDGVSLRAEGVQIRAGDAIVALPPTLRHRITYDPPLPADQDQLCQRFPLGSVIKIALVYDQPFWRDDGLNGIVESLDGPVTVTADNSPPGGTPGVLVAFLEGGFARRLGRVDDEVRRVAVLDHLSRLLGPRTGQPLAYHEVDWAAEPWTRGCYGGVLPPGGWTEFGHALREPVGRLHWAGSETAARFNGYMEGAVRSGERVAAEIIAAST